MSVFVLGILEKASLLHGKYPGIDAQAMEVNAAMKGIVRRDTGERYQKMLERLAEESGIKTPTIAFDRRRQGRKTTNKDWQSATDEEARIARVKDGRTHMAYKPEHVVDLESGAIVSAVIHPADQGDTATLATTLDDAQAKLCVIRSKEEAASLENPFDLVADKGQLRWKGDMDVRDAVYGNRARLKSEKGKALLRARGEQVERSFAHCLDRGGMRRSLLRGIENVEKRSIIHVAGFNLGVLLRALFGFGTPKGRADAGAGLIFARIGKLNLLILAIWLPNEADAPDYAMIVISRWNN